LLPVVFGVLVFKLSVWCRAVGCVSGLRDAASTYARKMFGPKREEVTGGWRKWPDVILHN
jgi:hypothetical protein